MARIARVVAPGAPHHVTQRGNRRMQTFFSDEDYQLYIDLAAEWMEVRGVEIWAYCLMPNHVHFIAAPKAADSMRRGFGEVHRRYSRAVNFCENWRGFLWQGRFASCVMDEPHLLAAARYIETNPVRAGLASRPEDWPWSSARAHLSGEDDIIVNVQPIIQRVPYPRSQFLDLPVASDQLHKIRQHSRTGRPLGDRDFLKSLERKLRIPLLPKPPGPQPKSKDLKHAEKQNKKRGQK